MKSPTCGVLPLIRTIWFINIILLSTPHTAAVHAYPAHTHPDSCCCYFCAAVDIRILGTKNPKDKKKKLLFDLPTSLFAINNCSCGSHSFSACLWWNPKNKHIHPPPAYDSSYTLCEWEQRFSSTIPNIHALWIPCSLAISFYSPPPHKKGQISECLTFWCSSCCWLSFTSCNPPRTPLQFNRPPYGRVCVVRQTVFLTTDRLSGDDKNPGPSVYMET